MNHDHRPKEGEVQYHGRYDDVAAAVAATVAAAAAAM